MKNEKIHKIILFDGVCNLCNSSINFVIRHDKNDLFKFAALQSDFGIEAIEEYGINTANTDSIILIDNNKIYVKSTAALRVAKNLNGGYPLLYGFMIVPKIIRNWVYDYVAKNRYKWYGRKDSCMIPTPELKERFL